MNTALPTVPPIGSRRPSPSSGKALHAYAVGLAFLTFLLVIAGGLVTSTGSALAVPDWPLSFGTFFPPMVGGVRYEHGHRMIAAAAGFLTLILAAWLWRAEQRRLLRRLGLWAAGLVVAQGILGGVTVLLKLPTVTSVAHACLGQIYFSLMVCIAFLTSPQAFDAPRLPYIGAAKLQRLAAMTAGFVFIQLLLGAVLRHTGLGLHLHLLGAFLVTVHWILLSRRIFSEPSFGPELWRPALAGISLVGLQLVLGFYSWRLPSVAVTTAHVGTGALILACTAVITTQSYRRFVVV